MASGFKGIFMFTDWLHLRAEVYGFLPVSEIKEADNFKAVYNPQQFNKVKLMGTGALVFQSAFGPVSFSVSYYDKSQTKVFAMLNFGYILFNRKGY